MVVDQVDIVYLAFVEAEDDPPVAGNRNTPERLQITLQRMKPVSGQVEVRWSAGVVEVRESNRETVGLIGADPATVISLVQALETPVTEAAYQWGVYRIPVRVSIVPPAL